jgi:DUF4097 and DUF4098 domain-containing protein YvlB
MKKNIMGFALFAILAGLMIPTASSQDLQKTYSLPPGGTISIANLSGNISVTGYNGSALSISAIREGRDKQMVEIVDQSTPDHVSLKVQYPRDGGNYEASVRFVVQVPAGSHFKYDKLSTASGDISITSVAGEFGVNTASGDITISQVEGEVHANTASGDLKITQVQGNVQANAASGDISIQGATGVVSANTASGDVQVELIRVEGSGEMKFNSASGDVTVKVPNQLNAQVELSTGSGSIKSDFPLTIEDREGHGKKASGRFGTGTVLLKMSAASGDLNLIK